MTRAVQSGMSFSTVPGVQMAHVGCLESRDENLPSRDPQPESAPYYSPYTQAVNNSFQHLQSVPQESLGRTGFSSSMAPIPGLSTIPPAQGALNEMSLGSYRSADMRGPPFSPRFISPKEFQENVDGGVGLDRYVVSCFLCPSRLMLGTSKL